jgi:hypothetical protein
MGDQWIEKHHLPSLASHNVINRLSVIVGTCQLVEEEANRTGVLDSNCMRRIGDVRKIAIEIVKELREHTSQIDTVTNTILLCNVVESLHRDNVNDPRPCSSQTARKQDNPAEGVNTKRDAVVAHRPSF